MLKAEGLKKSYGALNVLKGVDIEINKGEVVSIVGASGAGKSTLLHILGTLDKPDEGRLYLAGKEVFTQSAKDLADFRNKNLGFVFQFHNLLPEFSAMENIMIPGLIAKTEEKKVKDRSLKLLESLGLKDRAMHKPSELSGGEQQRVAVARALINEPALIFADEPSGNLDSNNAKELHQLFFKLRDDFGQTFVIVTHNQEFAAMTDRKLEIKDGKMVN
ncbi:MAG: ABC transporter ATP-binding protein [Flammeovirgaceae bacterium]|jgi:lipoprotein-releasing system ATP-binding protein|nr:ABC transporter ATP-binding protein [Flammeovirgaceae bacterium]MBP9925455.1 ABC transporter ATP-binding protein [Cyclobacteriaceae bacterium]